MGRHLLCSAAFVLSACMAFRAVCASTVAVPDNFSTVQSAIDSGADTVLVRDGSYPERPAVDHAVVLQGIGIARRPRLEGLAIFNTNFWANPPLLSVVRLDFSGRVEHTTVAIHPRNLELTFSECSLDSGFYQVFSEDDHDISTLTLRNCHMKGHSSARAFAFSMAADTIDGSVSWDNHAASIDSCWFTGAPGAAIELYDMPLGSASHNRIENYDTGMDVQDAEDYLLEGNSIRGCGRGIRLRGGSVKLTDNEIQDCGTGIYAGSMFDFSITGNTIMKTAGPGMLIYYVDNYFQIERNLVGECGGPGMRVEWGPWGFSGVLQGNTVFRNAGSGMELIRPPTSFPAILVENNIGFQNGGWGLSFAGGGPVQLACNDWFGNELGPVAGVAVDSTDLSVDPLFCNVAGADVSLDAWSPLANAAGCGQIGALGVGCGVTATLVRRFTAERTSDGIRIVWEVAEGGTASAVWLERSEALEGPAWIRPPTELSVGGLAVVELDRGVASDRTYWYRLVALEGDHPVVIGPPAVVEGQARPEFRLLEVGPNPGSGPVRITFALKHAAAIELDVFDVLGRRVAPLVRGVRPAGTQVVEWDGRTENGAVAPTGLYLLRYSYPGGQDRRTIVRMR